MANSSPSAAAPSILVQIRALMPSLAPAEQRVAQAAIDDPAGTSASTISELATRCSTSETTVVRFCRQLGFSGYPQLRLALAAAVGRAEASAPYVSGQILPDDSVADVISKISSADALAITETAAQLDHRTVTKLATLLHRARRIDIYGVGASANVAQDLQQKLHRIGKFAYATPDPHAARVSAALLGSRDVALAISHTGTTRDTLDCLRIAREAGARTAAITNFPRSPVTALADLVLTTAARETTFRTGAMASRIAQLTLIDTIFVLVAQKDPQAATAALRRTYDAVQQTRT